MPGAKKSAPRFPLAIRAEDEERAARELAAHSLTDFYVLNPGGGWLSKCWPARALRRIASHARRRYGWRGVVTFGPGEEDLAREVVQAAGDPAPVRDPARSRSVDGADAARRFVVSADTGPLHLAAALDTPVVGLFGPTDPARNGPYSLDPSRHIVLRNPQNCETTYRRGKSYSPAMLSLGVPQVADAIARRWGNAS